MWKLPSEHGDYNYFQEGEWVIDGFLALLWVRPGAKWKMKGVQLCRVDRPRKETFWLNSWHVWRANYRKIKAYCIETMTPRKHYAYLRPYQIQKFIIANKKEHNQTLARIKEQIEAKPNFTHYTEEHLQQMKSVRAKFLHYCEDMKDIRNLSEKIRALKEFQCDQLDGDEYWSNDGSQTGSLYDSDDIDNNWLDANDGNNNNNNME